MKTLILLISFCFILNKSFSQKFAISTAEANTMYMGMDNILSIAVEGLKSEALIVSSNNGVIKAEAGHYTFKADFWKPTEIIIEKKVGNELVEIGRKTFHMIYGPLPTIQIGSGLVRISAFDCKNIWKKAFLVWPVGYEPNQHYLIDSFTVTVLHYESNTFASCVNAGDTLTNKTRNLLSNLNTADKIIIDGVYLSDEKKNIYGANEATYYIY